MVCSQTCSKRSIFGTKKRWSFKTGDLLKRLYSYEIFHVRTRKMWPFNSFIVVITMGKFDCQFMSVLRSGLKYIALNIWGFKVKVCFAGYKHIHVCYREYFAWLIHNGEFDWLINVLVLKGIGYAHFCMYVVWW